MSQAIIIKELKKTYRDAKEETLHGIDLSVPKGQFIGILGPNGAGKTTTISCITGVTSPTGGSVSVLGYDVVDDYREARKNIGVSPQEFTVDIFQTVDDILDYQAGFFGIVGDEMKKRREELLALFELTTHRDKKFQFLSGGLKRRTMLAKAMMHNPTILILDEPTAGVDVETRQSLWKYLRTLHAEGKTIVLTSHYLEEIEALCERVAIIKGGKIIQDGTLEAITQGRKLEEAYLALIGHNA
jgi:ABC-2 type transport system ATP-binding protein